MECKCEAPSCTGYIGGDANAKVGLFRARAVAVCLSISANWRAVASRHAQRKVAIARQILLN